MHNVQFRLKFSSGGRYRIYSDAARTQEVVSEDTEFPANTTTVYLQGLKLRRVGKWGHSGMALT